MIFRNKNMKTALFLPNGIGLAHLGRLSCIAKELFKLNIEVVFGGGPEAFDFIRNEGFKIYRLADFTRELYERTIKKNNFFVYNNYNTNTDCFRLTNLQI